MFQRWRALLTSHQVFLKLLSVTLHDELAPLGTLALSAISYSGEILQDTSQVSCLSVAVLSLVDLQSGQRIAESGRRDDVLNLSFHAGVATNRLAIRVKALKAMYYKPFWDRLIAVIPYLAPPPDPTAPPPPPPSSPPPLAVQYPPLQLELWLTNGEVIAKDKFEEDIHAAIPLASYSIRTIRTNPCFQETECLLKFTFSQKMCRRTRSF